MNPTNTLNGIRIYSKGDFKTKPVIFIHGNSLSAATFKHQFNELKLPLLAFDLPGHGESTRFENYEKIYSLPGYINALKDIINHLEIKEFILAGHSLGGHIAIESLNTIDGTKGVMIFGTPPIGIPPEMDKMFYPNPVLGNLYTPDITEEEALNLTNEFVHNNKEIASQLAKMVLSTDGNCRSNLGASIGKGEFLNEKEIVENSALPFAILHGENEKLIQWDYINSLQVKNLWSGKKHLISNCGHSPQLEKPQVFNELLNSFYSSIFN